MKTNTDIKDYNVNTVTLREMDKVLKEVIEECQSVDITNGLVQDESSESEEDEDYEERNEIINLKKEIERVRYQNISIITRCEQVEEEGIEYRKTIQMLKKVIHEKKESEKEKDSEIKAKTKQVDDLNEMMNLYKSKEKENEEIINTREKEQEELSKKVEAVKHKNKEL